MEHDSQLNNNLRDYVHCSGPFESQLSAPIKTHEVATSTGLVDMNEKGKTSKNTSVAMHGSHKGR